MAREDLTKAIMKRSGLKNKHLDNRCEINMKAYSTKTSLCIPMITKEKLTARGFHFLETHRNPVSCF